MDSASGVSAKPSVPSTNTGQREHFIPIRKADLVKLLADELPGPADEREQFLQLCQLLDATFHFEYHERLEELKNAYAWFDPDADTRLRSSLPAVAHDEQVQVLFDKLTALLERANYVRVTHEQIKEALEGASDWGVNLDVDLDAFDRLEIFSRGEIIENRSRRRLRNLYRQRHVEVPLYQRLMVAFRPKPSRRAVEGLDPNTVYMKIFKSIPKMDLEMLLPGGRVQMGLFDRGRIVLPAVSGMAVTLYKLLTGALVLAVAGTYELLTLLGLVGGSFGYGIKSFLGYLRAKDKYQLNLTRSLYYQNLDNNAGVLFRLLDEAEEQEIRETVLAYHLLRTRAESRVSENDLDLCAEKFLLEAIGVDVDFEVDDALAKLKRLGLVDVLPSGEMRAVPIAEALRRLDSAWDSIFLYSNNANDAKAA